ncbi:MAG: transglutaminase domain-containing protein [Myxococcales bacterium]|nr:DUF3488 and transglutaminase-like domain-containing protein [Polyangiaceae bacterium]MDW8249178.1 transglutaminase domain-containing protein [Myxococcales bacterium]
MVTLVVLYAGVGQDPFAALVLTPVALLPGLLRWRIRLNLFAQGGLSLALLGIAAFLVRLLPGPQVPFRGVMGPLVPFLATASILIAAHRLFLDQPAGGDRATVAHGFWCLVACGSQRAGLLYALGCTLYLALAGAWLRYPSKPWALGRHRGWWVLILTLSSLLAGALAWVIPKAHARIVGWLIEVSTTQIGLHDGPLELGSLEGLADSDRIVARIFHFEGDPLLRGVVYHDYNRGRWLTRQTGLTRSTPISGAGGPVEIRLERSDSPRFLLPLASRNLALNTPSALVDPSGIFLPIYGTSAQWARYEPGPRDLHLPEPVQPVDLSLPPRMLSALEAIARRFVGDATDPQEQLLRLQRGLQAEHPYATSFRRPSQAEPLLAFLETPGAGGHCEYFASALALLARSLGIPTRVIGGYRVSEFNRVGGYHVVRERNAHAWVEAYLPGQGWVSWDPTPAVSLEVAGSLETPLLGAWWDAILIWGGEGFQWALDHPSKVALGLGPVALWILLRELWRRRQAARETRLPGILEQIDPPPAALHQLLRTLERSGFPRGASEPLEAMARRLEEQRPGDGAAVLLQRYAALRYGGVGQEEELAAAVTRYCARRGSTAE